MTALTFSIEKRIAMKHGAGGRAMRDLIGEVFLRGFADAPLDGVGLAAMDDGAAIRIGDQYLILTTDSHVIQPIFFPGGDIGRLAVSGTVNDLSMMGAPNILGLTCGVIIEDGFPLVQLERIQQSMVDACREAGTTIVTGDTKVMGRGEIDGIVINTAGAALTTHVVRDCGLRPADILIVTGSLGDHGMAIMSARHAFDLEGELRSDVAPINALIRNALFVAGDKIVAMKDPTRGGVASTLHEMAQKSNVGIVIDQAAVPITDAVRAAADMLGIDPLQVANEGKAVIGVRPEAADRVLDILRRHPLGRDAAIIARCTDDYAGNVILDTGYGRRLLIESEGEPLPRIC